MKRIWWCTKNSIVRIVANAVIIIQGLDQLKNVMQTEYVIQRYPKDWVVFSLGMNWAYTKRVLFVCLLPIAIMSKFPLDKANYLYSKESGLWLCQGKVASLNQSTFSACYFLYCLLCILLALLFFLFFINSLWRQPYSYAWELLLYVLIN